MGNAGEHARFDQGGTGVPHRLPKQTDGGTSQWLRPSEIRMAIAAAAAKLISAVRKAPRSWRPLSTTNKAASPMADAIIIAKGHGVRRSKIKTGITAKTSSAFFDIFIFSSPFVVRLFVSKHRLTTAP